MKIIYTPPVSGSRPHPTGQVSERPDADFQKVLEGAIAEKTPACQPAGATMPACVPSSTRVEAVGVKVSSDIQRVARFVDALETYQKRLENPHCSLRDVAPALERLESEHRRLASWVEAASVDEALRDIASQGLVTASLEMHRFRSGLYC